MNFKKIKTVIFESRRLLGIGGFLLIWEISPRLGWVDQSFIPPFSEVITTLISLILSGELEKHILISLQRSVLGFGLGLLIAIPLGLIIGWFKGFEFYMDPLLQTFRQTSTIALLPVFMFLFGIGEISKVAIVFWGVQWAILLNTISGVKSVDPLLIKSARSMGASPLTMFIKVILPSAFPTIFTGIRLSATTSILILIAAEMLGASKGLGFLLFDAEVKYQIPKMFAVIITMSILGLIVNYSLQAIEKRVTHWKEELTTNGG
ncbi:ABC transporter permease [Paenibacillus durus]|uniref:ABC transporter permease n=1 Tax=Paenibacillus durus TaxID=44251 RepID=UPI00046E7376|nr:ABC transporter permease [Paenibacillus durus]